jgi:hypothetical protein
LPAAQLAIAIFEVGTDLARGYGNWARAGAPVLKLSPIAPFACTIFLAGCAAADVTSIKMSQPGDENLSCEAINEQLASNSAAAQKFLAQDRKVANTNIVKGVGAAIPWVGPLVMASADLSNKEQVEARALIDRDERLEFLSKKKNCSS